ncbi:MAG: hypothetical protein HY681_07730 [Chloroflexi bacterium]|nr:hypothetical protein [Chloroflexota bacterium]
MRGQVAAQEGARERREQEAAANLRAILQRVEKLERSMADLRQLITNRGVGPKKKLAEPHVSVVSDKV